MHCKLCQGLQSVLRNAVPLFDRKWVICRFELDTGTLANWTSVQIGLQIQG